MITDNNNTRLSMESRPIYIYDDNNKIIGSKQVNFISIYQNNTEVLLRIRDDLKLKSILNLYNKLIDSLYLKNSKKFKTTYAALNKE